MGWQSAAKDDVVATPSSVPKDGKHEVIFPIAVPDEGTFHWLDQFLEKNPHYVELSDRKIIEWATQSGLWKPKCNQSKASNDKPDVSFGIQHLDEMSTRRVIHTIAPLIPRNYVVMEVRQNLIKTERKSMLNRFSATIFRRKAHVVMGEPPEDYKAKVRATLLKEKQNKLEQGWLLQQVEQERRRQIELRTHQIEQSVQGGIGQI